MVEEQLIGLILDDIPHHHPIVFHLQIKEDKVWVYEDNTALEIAAIIAKEGIPKSKMVLGFLPIHSREVSEYGVS